MMKNPDPDANRYQKRGILADFKDELFNFQQYLI